MRFGVILQSWSLLAEHVQNLLGGAGQTMLDLVLAMGVAIAMFLGGVARRVFAGVGLKGSRVRGQAVTIVLTCFAVLLSLEQLGLAAQFIIALGLTGVAAVGLGAALAFGLGCRDLARDFVVEYLRSL